MPDIMCRLVARDFKPSGEKNSWDIFAAMPPLEAKKLLMRYAALQKFKPRCKGIGSKLKLLSIDAKKANSNGKVEDGEHIYVQLSCEAGAAGKCGALKRWLYDRFPEVGVFTHCLLS